MKCLWCGEEVERAQPILSFLLGANRKCICVNCEHPFIELKQHPTCLECGRLMTKVEVCPDCQKWHQVKEAVLLKNTALYAYDEAGRKFMELFKFVGDTRVAQISKEGIRSLSIAFVQSESKKKRIRDDSNFTETVPCASCFTFRTYWQWEEAIREDKAGASATKATF